MNTWEKEEFLLLTEKALNEDDLDRFIDCLIQRDTFTGALLKNDPHIFEGEAQACLAREKEILRRLEQERKNIIEEIDKVAKNKRAIKKYSSRFPFPGTPRFFNKAG